MYIIKDKKTGEWLYGSNSKAAVEARLQRLRDDQFLQLAFEEVPLAGEDKSVRGQEVRHE